MKYLLGLFALFMFASPASASFYDMDAVREGVTIIASDESFVDTFLACDTTDASFYYHEYGDVHTFSIYQNCWFAEARISRIIHIDWVARTYWVGLNHNN